MLPEITHLQFAVLSLLLEHDQAGRDMRAALAKLGQKKSLASFYQLMARMEEAELVEGWYETKTIAGQGVKERWYKITSQGLRVCESTRAFYADRAWAVGGASPLGGLANA